MRHRGQSFEDWSIYGNQPYRRNPKRTKPSILGVFVRLNNRKTYIWGKSFQDAGYPFAIPTVESWREIHDWCRKTFGMKNGRAAYSWTGHVFWFLTEEDRAKFVAVWGNDPSKLPDYHKE